MVYVCAHMRVCVRAHASAHYCASYRAIEIWPFAHARQALYHWVASPAPSLLFEAGFQSLALEFWSLDSASLVAGIIGLG